jgi:chromosome segregation ATPase
LRLPERVLEALDELAELRAIRSELTRVRKQTEPLAELPPALEAMKDELGTRLDGVRDVVVALESERSHLNRSVGGLSDKVDALHEVLAPVDERLTTIERATSVLAREVTAIHETVRDVNENIQRMSGLRGERGLAERARDRVVGSKD